MSEPMKPVYLPVKRKWFELYAKGEKTVELRRMGTRITAQITRYTPLEANIGREVRIRLGHRSKQEIRGIIRDVKIYPLVEAIPDEVLRMACVSRMEAADMFEDEPILAIFIEVVSSAQAGPDERG